MNKHFVEKKNSAAELQFTYMYMYFIQGPYTASIYVPALYHGFS